MYTYNYKPSQNNNYSRITGKCRKHVNSTLSSIKTMNEFWSQFNLRTEDSPLEMIISSSKFQLFFQR